MSKKFLLGAAALLISTAAAQAGPILVPPPVLSAVGDVTAVYVLGDAGDTSVLNELTPQSISTIFCNHPSGSCAGNVAGDIAPLGLQSGAMTFSLADMTTGSTFTSNVADAGGAYHVLISSDFSAFNAGALPSAAKTVIDALIASGKAVTYVGWEDHTAAQSGDFDYNDLIFAFANTITAPPPTGVPEPMSIALFGAGLLGAGWLASRKVRKQS